MRYICMPLDKNVGRNYIVQHVGVKLTKCPMCGRECYETSEARKLKRLYGYKAVCTECALKAGLGKK